jgi:hypothetical protein
MDKSPGWPRISLDVDYGCAGADVLDVVRPSIEGIETPNGNRLHASTIEDDR